MITSRRVLTGSAAGSGVAGGFAQGVIATSEPGHIGFLPPLTDADSSTGIGISRGTVLAVPQSRPDHQTGTAAKVPKSQRMAEVVVRLEPYLLAALRRAFALTAGELPLPHMVVNCVEIKLRTITTVPGLPYILYLTRDELSAITFCLYAASDRLREDDFIALDALFEHADYVLAECE